MSRRRTGAPSSIGSRSAARVRPTPTADGRRREMASPEAVMQKYDKSWMQKDLGKKGVGYEDFSRAYNEIVGGIKEGTITKDTYQAKSGKFELEIGFTAKDGAKWDPHDRYAYAISLLQHIKAK